MAFRWSWNTTAPMRSPSGLQVEALAPEREVQHVEQGNDEPRDVTSPAGACCDGIRLRSSAA